MSVIIIILYVLAIFYCIWLFSKNRTSRSGYKAGTILMLGDQTASEKLDEIELRNVSMKLRPDEACYFEGEGFSYHSKEVVSGYKRSSYGSSVRVMRGYSVHRSNGQSNVIRKTVETEYPGRLFITNERIVFLAERYGFDIGFDKLSNITMHNAYLEVFAGSKFYRVYTPHTLFIRDLIVLMNICHEDQYPEEEKAYNDCFDNEYNKQQHNIKGSSNLKPNVLREKEGVKTMKKNRSTVTTEENHLNACKNDKMIILYKKLKDAIFKDFVDAGTGATSYYVHWNVSGTSRTRQFANFYIQKEKIRILTLTPKTNYGIGEAVPDTHLWVLNYQTDIFSDVDIDKVKEIILDSYNQIVQLI